MHQKKQAVSLHKKLILIGILSAATVAGTVLYYYQTYKPAAGQIVDFDYDRDAHFILDIFKTNWYWLVSSQDFSPEYVLKYRASSKDPQHMGNLTIKLLYQDGEPVGFVAYYKKMFYVGFVLFLGVRPEFRSKGYGAQLLQYAVDDFKKRGVTTVRLVTRVENYAAQAVYKKVGFTETSRDDTYVNFEKVV